ncbi:MAG TPA: hypothetical protein VF751_11530, partial [Chthoniobacterales bacterium]
SALTLLAERRVEQGGEIFNVVGDQPVTASDAHAWLSSRLKRPSLSTTVAPRLAKRGQSNKRVSNRKLRALGWAPRYPTFEIAMSKSILPSFGF